MKFISHNAVWALVALAALIMVAIVAAGDSHALVASLQALLASPGLVAMAAGPLAFQVKSDQGDDDADASTVAGIGAMLKKQYDGIEAFKARYDERFNALEAAVDKQLLKNQRSDLGSGKAAANSTQQWIDTKTQRPVHVLGSSDSLLSVKGGSGEAPLSLGRLLRGIVLGGRAADARVLEDERKALGVSSDPDGGYTVSGSLSSFWIDQLRSKMVLSQVGVRTVAMENGSLWLARLTADPTISWHGENASVPDSQPSFGLINLRAKTVVCLVKLSVELAQDSANIDSMLSRSITAAMAQAIDSAGLVGVTTDAAAAPAGVFNLAGRKKVTSIGAPTSWDFVIDGMYELMSDNVPMESIGAFVAHPGVWKKMCKLRTGIASDNTPLTMPQEVASLPKLWTTAAPLSAGTAKGIIADWRDLMFGICQDINVRVLQEAFFGSNLQVAVVAYARVDFAALRPASFCTLEGITV